MTAATLTAQTVMNQAAALLNDANRTQYTYVVQIPYLRMALQELREIFELNSVAVTQKTSALINLLAGATKIKYNIAPNVAPFLPNDFVEPITLWERSAGVDPWIPMSRRDFLPHSLSGVLTNQFVFYTWNNQEIEVLPSNQSNDIKMDYIQELFPTITDETTVINIVNAATFLEYRTAAIVADFIEHNKPRADALNTMASLGLDRVQGISAKSKQTIMTRRRPFRAGYKKMG